MIEPTILECRNLTKRFDATVAVKDLSFSLRKGDVFGIVGENGAGKSTLIKMLGGEHVPNGGTIAHSGREVQWRDSFDALRNGVGIVHQHPLLVEGFTVEENIFLGKEFVNSFDLVDEAKMAESARRTIREYPIFSSLDPQRKIQDMSAGEKQVVELLKVFSYEPDILILDEPTASLPKEEAERLFELIRRLNEEKRLTIIYISHKLEESFAICNRIMVMRNGENVGVLEREEFERARIIRMMMNYDLAEFYPPKALKAGPPLVEVRGLKTSKLGDIDLTINAGEIVGLYGLMGAGMSEVAEALFGLADIESGTIRMPASGTDPGIRASVNEMIARGVYLVPEDRIAKGLIPMFDIRENASLAHLGHNSPEKIINLRRERKLVKEGLERLHVKYADLSQGIGELSGGNQQKVVVGRWLLRDCTVLMVDDPTVGIDIGAKRDIYLLLRSLTAKGKGVLFVSSEITEIVGMADRIYTMRNGRITAELKGESVNQHNVLENIL
jgi:ABC-type sugar transport system ATPase subunit